MDTLFYYIIMKEKNDREKKQKGTKLIAPFVFYFVCGCARRYKSIIDVVDGEEKSSFSTEGILRMSRGEKRR